MGVPEDTAVLRVRMETVEVEVQKCRDRIHEVKDRQQLLLLLNEKVRLVMERVDKFETISTDTMSELRAVKARLSLLGILALAIVPPLTALLVKIL